VAIPPLSEHVLLADPDEVEREDLARLLGRSGYMVAVAANGQEALKIAHEVPPALVVLEIALGELSGYEVCRSLRAERGPELPIVFLSGGRTEPYDRVAGLLLGADDYIVKPYAPDELLARIRRLVERSKPTVDGYHLTKRELEVLQQLAEGLTQDEIGERLFISPKTVGTHIEHILAKLGVRRRAQAIALAYKQRLI
jgi:DNA-binding NarL/FixJ family response regulator